MKFLKPLLIAFCFMPAISYASLYKGVESTTCFKSQSDLSEGGKCLSKKYSESSQALDNVIADTVKLIKKNNDGPVFNSDDPNQTIGDIYSKYFLTAQKQWMDYRKTLCLAVASQIGQDAEDYGNYINQCEINLNKQHIQEIVGMGIKTEDN